MTLLREEKPRFTYLDSDSGLEASAHWKPFLLRWHQGKKLNSAVPPGTPDFSVLFCSGSGSFCDGN